MSGTFAQQVGRQRRRISKANAREERIAALHAQRTAEKAQILAERQARREREALARERLRAERRAAKVKAKDEVLTTRRRQKEADRRVRRRRQRREAFNARVSAYLRRVTRHFSTSR